MQKTASSWTKTCRNIHYTHTSINNIYQYLSSPWIMSHAAAAAKSLQSCLTLCDPIEGSPPGSPIPGILQARTLEWVAISFSNAWKWKVKVKSYLILGDPMDCSPPGSSVHGIFQARVLEWVPPPSPIVSHTHPYLELQHSIQFQITFLPPLHNNSQTPFQNPLPRANFRSFSR